MARVVVQAAVQDGLVRFVWVFQPDRSLFFIFFSVFVNVLYVVYLWPSLIHAAENLYSSLILFLSRCLLAVYHWNAGQFSNGVQGICLVFVVSISFC